LPRSGNRRNNAKPPKACFQMEVSCGGPVNGWTLFAVRKRKYPYTGQVEDYPQPKTYPCPQNSRLCRPTISEALGFNVPIPFAQLVDWIYDKAYRCVELFGDLVGLSATDGPARYDSIPCELFPFGTTGVDGDDYGYSYRSGDRIGRYPGYVVLTAPGSSNWAGGFLKRMRCRFLQSRCDPCRLGA